jgi:hypothetical protein
MEQCFFQQERRSREETNSRVSQHESSSNKSASSTPGRGEKPGYYQEKPRSKAKGQLIFEASRHPADREDFEATGNETYVPTSTKNKRMSYL